MKLPRPLSGVVAFSLMLLAALPAFAASAPKKVLVVTVTTGFRHSSIPMAEKILAQLAQESGKFTVDFVRQPEGMPKAPGKPRGNDAAGLKKFEEEEKAYNAEWMPKVEAALRKLSPENLKNYDAVLFASTTGDLPLPDKQGFLDWIAAGHAFIGIHAATDTFHGFRPFIAMIGGEFNHHGPQVSVECINQDSAHAAGKPVPAKWTVFDEIYQMKTFERAKVHGILSLTQLQVDDNPEKQVPGDWPVAWSKMHGQGRVFYTSLGHREDLWDPTWVDKSAQRKDPKDDGRKNAAARAKIYQQHVLGGILWALGLAPGSGKP